MTATLAPTLESNTELEPLVLAFKALSDPARLKIVQHLASDAVGCCGDGICACDLETVTGLSQPTISHHMKCLQLANLVISEKRGKWTYYALNAQGFRQLKSFIKCC
jgi:ArsR family transcriptional regulator, arsenate/arsenite/antimonite-responsive transcriptional repressor